MDDNFVLVKYLSTVNSVIKRTFQSMQRIKLVCFDSSQNFLVFGATSGGIYIFRREPCEFLKLIPSKEGSANLLAISKDERHIGIASSRGLILILENFIEDSNIQYQVFTEHEGQNITYIKWYRNELYVGDQKGKVSVVSIVSNIFPTKSIFQVPTAALMILDSSIVQIDAYQSYLLISTKTKTYLCNTEKEHFIQIGKKLREGNFGACFCNTLNDTEEIQISQTTRSAFQWIQPNELLPSNETFSNTKIFCARPGARIWEVGFDAKVLVTYQFKSSLDLKLSDIIVIGCEEESVLEKIVFSNSDDMKVSGNFNFQQIYPLCDRFVLTYDTDKLYIFDPVSNKLVFWTAFSSSIKSIQFVNSNFYVWKNNLEINVFSVVDLENLIISTLYRRQYYLCTEICIDFKQQIMQLVEDSKKLYLLSILKSKINCDNLLKELEPILDKLKDKNEKFVARREKGGNIVFVENLYKNEEVPPKLAIEDENKDLKIISKQYKLNKIHKTIEIPEVTQLFESLDPEDLFSELKKFAEYIKSEFKEDSIEWCQNQYLKQISKRNVAAKDLGEEDLEFLTLGVIKANEALNFACRCGYPLPKCHKSLPNFYKTALEVLDTRKNGDKILKNIPYLWKYRLKTEVYGLNMTALIQYSHLDLFREHTVHLTYDNWHDILGYFVKINKGLCLNCDRKIDIASLLTWTEIAKIIVQTLGPKNALRILEKYEKVIPNGALDPTFYQTCIFAHSFDNIEAGVPFKFVEELDRAGYNQFQQTLANYFKRKYAAHKTTTCYRLSVDNVGTCFTCKLPLKNDILYECQTMPSCGHKFHKFCLERSGGKCTGCDN